jgi:MYXO-CTERM domain-containing protein
LTRYCGSPPPDDGSGNGGTPSDECVEVTESWCDLTYQLPCEGDAQCGTGFTCKPLEDCDCSDPDAPIPPDCPCEYTKIKGCYTPIVACTEATASTACPAGWSCIENENGLCNVIGDLHTGCNPGDPPMVCVPPGFDGTVLVSDAGGDDPPVEDGDAPAGTPMDPPTAGGGGGCSVRGAAQSGAGAVLAALAVAFGLHRRRRKG